MIYNTGQLSRADVVVILPLGDCIGGWHANGCEVTFIFYLVQPALVLEDWGCHLHLFLILCFFPVNSVKLDLRGCRLGEMPPSKEDSQAQDPTQRRPTPGLFERCLHQEQSAQGVRRLNWKKRPLESKYQNWREVFLKPRGVSCSPSTERGSSLGWKSRSWFNKRSLMPLGSLGWLFFNEIKAFFRASVQGLSFLCRILGLWRWKEC